MLTLIATTVTLGKTSIDLTWVLGFLLVVSEYLGATTKIKESSIFQLLLNALRAVAKKS